MTPAEDVTGWPSLDFQTTFKPHSSYAPMSARPLRLPSGGERVFQAEVWCCLFHAAVAAERAAGGLGWKLNCTRAASFGVNGAFRCAIQDCP